MAIYLVDRTRRIASMKESLIAAGAVTTELYTGAWDFIFTSPFSNKVIRICENGTIYIGDAWTSGTTISNQKTVQGTGADPVEWAIIVTPDVLAFCHRGGFVHSTVFCTTVDGTGKYVLAFCSADNSSQNQAWSWNTIPTVPVEMAPVSSLDSQIVRSPDGYYYQEDIYMREWNSGYVPHPSPMKGVKAIYAGSIVSPAFDIYQSDVVLRAYRTQNSYGLFFGGIAITNGKV